MLQGVINFRDVGGRRTVDGRRVRTGRLFRSAHLAKATDEDLVTLEQLGVTVVIDFRGPGDIAAEGEDRLPRGARLVSIPMFDPGRAADIRTLLYEGPPATVAELYGEGRAFEAMVRGAAALVTSPERAEQYGHMFNTIIDADGAVVFHCSAGKDRTGWAASLLLLALGVPEAEVIDHYLESNKHRVARAERLAQLERAGFDPGILEPFFTVHEAYARAAIDAVAQHWGDHDQYVLRCLGIDEGRLAQFRDAMLVD